ncbi:MAG TPA: hypothetical protein VKO86_09420 [Gemmatimonadales bacterium]|nr:hypothetical protein [Gemmatimonadales bacterium]
MTRFLLLAQLLASASSAAAQSAWRLVQTTDELTAASDTRLILREDAWPTEPPKAADSYRGATLVVVCGHRLPSDTGRTLLFSADQPMQPFGGDFAYVELRFDSDSQTTKAYFTTLPASGGIAVESGRSVPRYVSFLGSEQSPYFSPLIFARLLTADRVTIRYRAFSSDRTATFHVAGLAAAVVKLTECRWTQ